MGALTVPSVQSSVQTQGAQFIREVGLIVSNDTNLRDLSQLKIRFQVTNSDLETPNVAVIRVYNLSDSTINEIIAEYDTVSLQAGYVNANYGVIFAGTIKQFRRGKESNVDSFLDIYAADGDEFYNFSVLYKTLAAGSTKAQQLQTYSDALGATLDPNALDQATTGGVLPRGKVQWGMARDAFRDLAYNINCRWSIQNGVLTLVPLTGYLPNEIIYINSQTGMISIPEATDNGITVDILLNPLMRIGCRIAINEADIVTSAKNSYFINYNQPPTLTASTSTDGTYRVLQAEHFGVNRGNGADFKTSLVCLALDSPTGTAAAY